MRPFTQLGLLRSMELFNGCSRKELKQLATFCDVVDFRAGDVIVRQGGIGHDFFAVAEGRLEVVKDGRVVQRMAGGPVGEMALLNQCRRMATVTARTRGVALVFAEREFHWAMNISPALERRLTETVLARSA